MTPAAAMDPEEGLRRVQAESVDTAVMKMVNKPLIAAFFQHFDYFLVEIDLSGNQD